MIRWKTAKKKKVLSCLFVQNWPKILGYNEKSWYVLRDFTCNIYMISILTLKLQMLQIDCNKNHSHISLIYSENATARKERYDIRAVVRKSRAWASCPRRTMSVPCRNQLPARDDVRPLPELKSIGRTVGIQKRVKKTETWWKC